ncbi:MAG: Y-family DNA polymerase [Candidatus Paracaedimonas acanthamoebae]|uniref:DNA-directed DNA polymerase n=1 Tax=Candidatus Paracaedimonas acanthamoebae TaxID=244581 RepID=A0A8J7TSS6_9PROT|nr:Y-family DNA polymerase [Candidatus Paracaedimonas acanthamoebae]
MTYEDKPKIGLVDCNNFFVSCERVFRPDLKERPIVVLSNNDGCAISRSNEAKKLNIKMGEPYFKFISIVKKHNVQVFSSNFELYVDISRRVMTTLQTMVPLIEKYSIDEAFLDLSKIPDGEIEAFCYELQQRVQKWTGIPISIGVSRTKTLAKVANTYAKEGCGLFNLLEEREIEGFLACLPISDVWGIGRKYAAYLRSKNIETALQLKRVPLKWIRQKMNVIGERIVWELNGQIAYPIEKQESSKKTILVSRTFKDPFSSFEDLASFVSALIEKAAEKLRKEKRLATYVHIFIKTNRFHRESYYAKRHVVMLDVASNDTLILHRAAQIGLRKIFSFGPKYKRIGVCLSGLVEPSCLQYSLFNLSSLQQEGLTATIDQINEKFGKTVIMYGDFQVKTFKLTQREYLSPCYTTRWEQLAKVF